MGAARRRGRWAGLAWLVTAALALTGCSSGARTDFAQVFRGDPAIANLELTTGDNMPFTAGVRADVTVADDASDTQVSELLTRFSTFMREHSDEPVTITVHSGVITVPVFASQDVTQQAREAAATIAANAGVESVELTATSDIDHVTGVSLTVPADLGTAFSLARSTPATLASIAASGGVHVTVEDAATAVRISGIPGPWLEQAEAAWTRVNASFPVTGVRADADRIILTLAVEADAPGAQALIPRTDPAFPTPVLFASPLVLIGQNGTGDEARALLSQLDPDARSLIRYVWSNDVRIEFSVAIADQVSAVESALAAVPSELAGGLDVTVEVERK